MRALLIVLNGAGAGGAPDAAKYHDEGANTLGHLFEQHGNPELPALYSLGLGEIMGIAGTTPTGSFGRMRAASAGKDTTIAHWEIAGIISQEPFATFEKFPETLVNAIETAAKVKFLGNDPRRNGSLLAELGSEHLKTGMPILGVSPESVMRIYAHEAVVPRQRLHEISRAARKYCNTHRISRVIAQPFTGEDGNFTPAATHDYPTIPPRTVLNAISETGLHVDGIGWVSPIFARSGITAHHPVASDREGLAKIDRLWNAHRDGLIFASMGGFGLHGRERDAQGFIDGLLRFDQWLAGFMEKLDPDDLLIITADQGCDLTFPGSGNTREEVPLLVKYSEMSGSLGTRPTFADVAATLSAYFNLRQNWRTGTSFFSFPKRY